jgi:hypothetical protein
MGVSRQKAPRVLIWHIYVKLVPSPTWEAFEFLDAGNTFSKLAHPFSTTSATIKMSTMVDLEGLPPHLTASTHHKVSRLYCWLLLVVCASWELRMPSYFCFVVICHCHFYHFLIARHIAFTSSLTSCCSLTVLMTRAFADFLPYHKVNNRLHCWLLFALRGSSFD